MSTYLDTSPEHPTFTSSLYTYFSLTFSPEDSPSTHVPHPPLQATYTFQLFPDDLWVQLALRGNVVKLSPHKPWIFKTIVPCFERRDFVRLKSTQLNFLTQSSQGEMIWINERREVGVFTKVLKRQIVRAEGNDTFGREMRMDYGVPFYDRVQEGKIKYTLGFDYLALKTGFVFRFEACKTEILDFCWRSWRKRIGLIGILWLLSGEDRIKENCDPSGSNLRIVLAFCIGGWRYMAVG
jgi:hypothetical protein